MPNLVNYHKAHWKCADNAANTTVLDSLGLHNAVASANTSTLHASNGILDGCFNCAGAYAFSIADHADFNFEAGDASISLWVKNTASISSEQCLISKREWVSGTEDGYSIGFTSNTNFRVHYYSDHDFTVPNVADSNWHHIVLTFNYTNHTVKVYFDNSYIGSYAYTQDSQSNAYTLYVGRSNYSGGFYWNGTIDDVRFFKGTELDTTDVSELYNSGNGVESDFSNIIDYMEYSTNALAQAAYVTDAPYILATPVMTDYSAPSGTVSAYSELSTSYKAWYAFDNLITSCWIAAHAPSGGTPQWLKYDFGSGVTKIITKYILRNRDVNVNSPNTWTFEGSNDNSNWDVLQTVTNDTQNTGLAQRIYTFTNTTAYRYYRFNATTRNGGADDYMAINDLYLYESPIALTSYSEASIKTQGSYALKGIAAITSGLNKSLTHIISSTINLVGVNLLQFAIRASRTGSNIKIGLHDGNSPDDSYTKLLLHLDENVSDTATGKVVTNNSVTFSSTISKFGSAGYFNGSASLSVPDSDDWAMGTENFTIDFWINCTSISANACVLSLYDDAGNNRQLISFTANNALQFYASSGGTPIADFQTPDNTFVAGQWYHVAIVRNGAKEYIFVNGIVQPLTYTVNPDAATNYPNIASILRVGCQYYGWNFSGYLDEIRVSKGIARWAPTFTPLTGEYTSDSYDKLLLHCNGVDESTTFTDELSHTITAYNGAQLDTSVKKFGTASGLFDGSDDYISAGSHADWTLGNEDFTLDFWLYATADSTGRDGIIALQNGGSDVELHIGLGGSATGWSTNGNNICLGVNWNGASWGLQIKGNTNVCNSTWHHVAIVRSNDRWYIYVDGVLDAAGTYTFTILSNTPLIGTHITSDRFFAGQLDEIRLSRGIMRWSGSFVPPLINYGPVFEITPNIVAANEWQTINWDISAITNTNKNVINGIIITILNADAENTFYLDELGVSTSVTQDLNDSLSLSDLFELQVNPDNQSTSDSLSLHDEWDLEIFDGTLDIPDSFTLSDAWDAQVNPDNQSTSDSLSLSDIWEALTNPEQQVFSDSFTLSDNWVTSMLGTFAVKINTDFRWLYNLAIRISTSFSWLIGKAITTDFRWLGVAKKIINTDFRWLAKAYLEIPQTPVSLPDIRIVINGVDMVPINDVDMNTGNIRHDVGQSSQASFVLARKHDDLNRTHAGVASEITNQNPVQIYIYGHLEFDGFITNLNVNSETETVSVTAEMKQPADNRHTVELPLPSVNELIHPYQCLVNAVAIDNPKEDTTAVIIGNNNRYWNGTSWVFYIEDALIFGTDIDAQNYVDSYNDITENKIFETKHPSVTSSEKNIQYYKGIKINLGLEIQQQVDRFRMFETIFEGQGVIAKKIENGTFLAKPNYTYFWAVLAKNARTGVYNGDYRYIGTSLAATTTDLWILNGVVPMYQKIKENIETELGYYYIGEAPYKEISAKNGHLIPDEKWQDRRDGLYIVLEESYNYIDYAKLVADLEYQKLLNVHGDILPITSANLEVTFDAYYFYTIKLLTRINVTNTTVANTYNNLNGFPVSVKSISIDFKSMKVTLGTNNRLSQTEIDEIDEQMPDEESDLYLTPESASRVYRKFDLKSWTWVS
jgi:Concanavalin A-like lectin/glucanases superfamily/F5/8 type C domain